MDTGSFKFLSPSGSSNVPVSRNDMFRNAAASGDREIFESLLLSPEVDVYQRDRSGKTALMLVAENGHVECLRCLVNANKIENINQCDRSQTTALMMAAKNGHTECVRCMIETGRADVNLLDTRKWTALMLAAMNGSTECVRFLIDTGLADLNLCDKRGFTTLMLAATNGHFECLKCLVDVDKSENINKTSYTNQFTALMLAAMSGYTECVKYLIDTELADVNLLDRKRRSALMFATMSGVTECMSCLIDTRLVDINACDLDEYTALMYASKGGYYKSVRYLIETGQADVNLCNSGGFTAIMLAAINGHFECLKTLLGTKRIENINQCDKTQTTALMMAAKKGSTECIRYLIDTGLADLNLRDSDKRTALIFAAKKGHTECVRCLIDTGQADVNLCDRQDYTALMRAAKNGHLECVKYLTMAEGIAINLTDTYGRTALILAAEHGHLKCIESLVERGDIDINYHDFDKTTAFMMAAKNGHTECVGLLLSNEMLDMNASNQKGHTAFMLASMNGHIRCVELLLSHGKVDVNMRDNDGHTALMLSILKRRYQCAKCLIYNKNINDGERDNEGQTAFMLAVKMSSFYCLQCFFDIKVTEEVDLIDNDREGDQKEDKLATAFSLPYTDSSVRYFPGITWKRPYIYGREQEGKSVLKLVIRNGLPRCVVCFLLAGLEVSLSENVSCSHTLLDKRELCHFGQDGQTSVITAVQRRDFKSLEYLLQYERIRIHILVILLREEFFKTGTISLPFYKKLCSLIQNLKEIDRFMCMICNGYKIGVCVDYLLSAFICQIDSSNKSAISLPILLHDPTLLRILLEHVSEKNILMNHVEVSCNDYCFTDFNFQSLLELLKVNVFLWNWYPKYGAYIRNVLIRELVIRGFVPGCFEWNGKQSSPIHYAFMTGDEGLVRYLVANLYLTLRDLEHVQRDIGIREYLQLRGSDDLKRLYLELFCTPWRLETQSLLTLSNWVRINRNQNGMENIQCLIPDIFRSRLPFINPMRKICEEQWKQINLDFMNHRLATSLSDVNQRQGSCCIGGCLRFD